MLRPMAEDDPVAMRLLPQVGADTEFFWTSGSDGKLRFLRCQHCGYYVHPPSPRCPKCLTAEVQPEVVSGRATVFSYTVNHQQWVPGSEPYVVGLVELEEQDDLRLTTNIVGCDPDDVVIGMPVEVTFRPVDDVWLPQFLPARS